MILKCTREIPSEGLTVHRLYPVIAYAVDLEGNIASYQVVDDCHSLSWRQNERFVVVSQCRDEYIKLEENKKLQKYVHKDLIDGDFFIHYYLENEKSIAARAKLEKVFTLILANELTSIELLSSMDVIGHQDENRDLLLKAFFLRANKQDIINFTNDLYDNISEYHSYIVQIIVENLSEYKERAVENLFMQLYLNNSNCEKKAMDIINEYLIN